MYLISAYQFLCLIIHTNVHSKVLDGIKSIFQKEALKEHSISFKKYDKPVGSLLGKSWLYSCLSEVIYLELHLKKFCKLNFREIKQKQTKPYVNYR